MTSVPNLDVAPQSRSIDGVSGSSIASFARPANATDYSVGDVISDDVAAPKVLEFPDCAKRRGGGGSILRAHMTVDENMGTVPDLDLYLFATEPTNHLDNAALALADDDFAIAVLSLNAADIKVVNSSASPAGMVMFKTPLDLDHVFVCHPSVSSLYGLLVTRTAFTPVSGSKFRIQLQLWRDS